MRQSSFCGRDVGKGRHTDLDTWTFWENIFLKKSVDMFNMVHYLFGRRVLLDGALGRLEGPAGGQWGLGAVLQVPACRPNIGKTVSQN